MYIEEAKGDMAMLHENDPASGSESGGPGWLSLAMEQVARFVLDGTGECMQYGC